MYTPLMDARAVAGSDTILPVRFRTVERNGVDQGQVEIVNADSGEVFNHIRWSSLRVDNLDEQSLFRKK